MKAVFIDIDGTIVNDSGEVSGRTADAVKRIKTLGYIPVVCTGRTISTARQICVDANCDHLIFANGGGIYDFAADKIIYENPINPKSVVRLRDTVKHEKISTVFVTDGLIKETFVPGDKVVQMNLVSYDIKALPGVRAHIEEFPDLKIANQSKHFSNPSFHTENRYFFDVVCKNTSKGSGIVNFCKIFKLDKKDTIAIGDDMNDFAMFEECGYRVAMGNALPTLKKTADLVTDTNNNDGVAKFLETLT